jgi:hypothetical protein
MTQIERVKCAALATLSLGLVALPSSAQTNRVAESPSASVIAGKQHATADDKAIRPFRIKVPEETLTDFGRRLSATRWPDKETVTDRSAGRSTGDAQGPHELLADNLRLAQGRGESERLTAVHDDHRRGRYPLHSRPFP